MKITIATSIATSIATFDNKTLHLKGRSELYLADFVLVEFSNDKLHNSGNIFGSLT